MNTDDMPTDLIRVNQAAKLLNGSHANTVRRWIHSGKLRAWRINSFYLVSRAAVLDMIQPVEIEQDDTPKPRTTRERKRAHRLAMENLRARGVA